MRLKRYVIKLIVIILAVMLAKYFNYEWFYVLLGIKITIDLFVVVDYFTLNYAVSFIGFALSLAFKVLTFFTRLFFNKSVYEFLINNKQTYKPDEYAFFNAFKQEVIPLSKSQGYLLTRVFKKKQVHTTNKIIYQIQGSTYHKIYNYYAWQYSQLYQDAEVFSVDYRMDLHYLTSLEDIIEGYYYLLENYDAKDIIVVADGIGASLALSLAQYLKQNKNKLPKLVILSSPLLDWKMSNPTYHQKTYLDVLLGKTYLNFTRKLSFENIYQLPYKSYPSISLFEQDFSGLMPILIQVGANEMLVGDTMKFYNTFHHQKVDLDIYIYSGMYHNFYLITPLITKESRRAAQRIEEKINT